MALSVRHGGLFLLIVCCTCAAPLVALGGLHFTGDEHDTRVWTFTLVRRPRNVVHAAWQALWYHAYRKPAVLIATNEKEDLVVFKRERLNLERPQKLGPLDVGLIYFRRHLAQRARDYQRLGAARGALKPLPRRASPHTDGEDSNAAL
jgi:hypothetical protein